MFLYYEVFTLGYEEHDGLFVKTGDTFSYYEPMKSFLDGQGSLDACRMPAFVPLYAIPYYIFGESVANNFIIFCQFILSILSVYILGLIALKLTKNQWIAKLSILIYAISTFTSQYDLFGIADSLSISTLIIGVYCYFKFEENDDLKWILASGVFFTWSVFFRQIAIVAYGLIGFYLTVKYIKNKEFIPKLKRLAFFGFPLIVGLGIWTFYNKQVNNRFIPLVKPISECYSSYPEHHFELNKLPVAWGGISTPWNGEAEWFINPKMKKKDFPFNNVFTEEYNLDSLELLRQTHFATFDKERPQSERDSLAQIVSEKASLYVQSYKENYPLNYWLINRVVLFKKFLFPKYLDKLPLPPKNEMNLIEKGIKVFYILLLWFVHFFGLIGMFNRKYFSIPLLLISGGIISFLTFYLGWTEQRYLGPVYPFMIIYASIGIYSIVQLVKKFNLERK
ncbi:MAG: glycosyltransferase family 39 protein [Crocinitomicaceae bacterium]